MKKLLTLLLALMVVTSLALVALACDKDGAVSWETADKYDGMEGTITGTVVEAVDLSPGVTKVIIRLGGTEEEDHFNIGISLNEDGSWPDYLADVKALVDDAENLLIGKMVEVTGFVNTNPYENCFEINLSDSDDSGHDPDPEAVGTMVVQ